MPKSKRRQRQSKNQKELKDLRKVRDIFPQTPNQQLYFDAIANNQIVFVSGSAGCGKSLIALYHALKYLEQGLISKIIIVRPLISINTGELSLGALPGTALEKVLPFAMGLFDNAELLIDRSYLESLIVNGTIEFLPLVLCRGRTFHNAFIISEESQNISVESDGMKALLTRIGQDSKMVINGDLEQKDIAKGKRSALEDAMKRFEGLKGISIIKMTKADIIRNPLISEILKRYEQ